MIVKGLDDDFEDTLEDFIEPKSKRFLTKISRPNKDTILHDFIRSITDYHYDEHILAKVSRFCDSGAVGR